MVMPKGEVLSSSPAAQSTPAILVPSSKLFCTYLAEIQPVTTCIKSLDSLPCFHVHVNASKWKGWKDCMDDENEKVCFADV